MTWKYKNEWVKYSIRRVEKRNEIIATVEFETNLRLYTEKESEIFSYKLTEKKL